MYCSCYSNTMVLQPCKWVEAAADRSFLPTGRVEKPGWWRRSPMRWGLRSPVGSCVGVERERKLRLKCTRRKRWQGGCLRLRSPWRGSRRRRWPDSGSGTLGQRHDAQTVMWLASDTGDGAFETGMREARRGRRQQHGGVFGHDQSETGPESTSPGMRILTFLPCRRCVVTEK
jgi:hypothetical protein